MLKVLHPYNLSPKNILFTVRLSSYSPVGFILLLFHSNIKSIVSFKDLPEFLQNPLKHAIVILRVPSEAPFSEIYLIHGGVKLYLLLNLLSFLEFLSV